MKDPEIRVNPWTGASVIVAPLRAARPHQFDAVEPQSQVDDDCPFCRGKEQLTPQSLVALDAAAQPANDSNWEVRVIPNKFPAVSEVPHSATEAEPPSSLLPTQPAYGSHEVVIESPRHVSRASQIPTANLELTLNALEQRVMTLRQDARIKHIQIFKNCGEAAGASIVHTHSQIIAFSQVPPQLAVATKREEKHLAEHQQRLWETVVDKLDADLVIGESTNLIAFCPSFSALPFELWLGPKASCGLAWHSAELRAELAAQLARYTCLVETLTDGCAWNWYLQETAGPAGHWHFVILPRLTSIAGFEWATGMTINPIDPLTAAAELRK